MTARLMAAIPDNIRTELGDHYDFEREKVRNDPRFTAIARKVGLLPATSAPTSSPFRLSRIFRQT